MPLAQSNSYAHSADSNRPSHFLGTRTLRGGTLPNHPDRAVPRNLRVPDVMPKHMPQRAVTEVTFGTVLEWILDMRESQRPSRT